MFDFDIFIISHGRAETMTTYSHLKNAGYTGRIWVVIDDEDQQGDLYKAKYGDEVVVFNKQHRVEVDDTCDNFTGRSISLYRRNAVRDMAAEKGLDYYGLFDDDLVDLVYRYPEDNKLKTKKISNIDEAIKAYVDFMRVDSRITMVGFKSQAQMHGGLANYQELKRAAYCYFIIAGNAPKWRGRSIEDTCNSMELGRLLFTPSFIAWTGGDRESNGGVQDGHGWWTSATVLMMYPNAYDVGMKQDKNRGRWHGEQHKKPNAVFPKILGQKWKKTKIKCYGNSNLKNEVKGNSASS